MASYANVGIATPKKDEPAHSTQCLWARGGCCGQKRSRDEDFGARTRPALGAGRVSLPNSGGKSRGFGEIDGGSSDVVEVVREDVQPDVGHDLGDLGIAVSGLAHCRDV